MDFEAALQTFIAECRELLADMETALLGLAKSADRGEAVNAIFRAAHTIKGSAGLMGLDHVVAFTHVVESLLDEVRDGRIVIDEALTVLMLATCDHLQRLVDDIGAGRPPVEPDTAGAALVTRLERYIEAARPTAVAVIEPPAGATLQRVARDEGDGNAQGHWHLSLRFNPGVLCLGLDPLSFLRKLKRRGRIVAIVTITDGLPAADAMLPEACYLGFEIAFASDADKASIENVFESVRDKCTLRLLPPRSRVEAYVQLIQSMPDGGARLGEMLVACGSVSQRELAEALAAQEGASSPQPPKLGSIPVAQQAVAPEVEEAALLEQKTTRQGESRSLRIDADKLDHLINLVGELIIAGAGADLLAHQLRHGELLEATSRVSALVQDVRDCALQLRMVKIGATFTRFERVVHDVSRELGKDIELRISGEEAELDKTVVEKIADPLMHLVRNAIDHGIEPAEARVARGKPARGVVSLNAFHESGSIVIEVGDDGGGLNRERILAKAMERGLVDAKQRLSDSEVFELIFEPGFSTAEQITSLSGRGVGMDVVKRNITSLRGSVCVRSEPGRGTTVSVRLPLTLAIIDGFLVGVGPSVFVVPLDVIDECIESSAQAGHAYCDLRGQMLPLIRLRDHFEIDAPLPRRESVVVIDHAGQRVGLAVDALLGEFQTVINPLSRVFNQVKSISGSTILGSGGAALILDVPALIADHTALRAPSRNKTV
ncbi:chemotaxis protein CheA [Caldimonas brevitalea]|uniref:Chemotaxis protein CheA n=1 Tax=Caldimonas brevitalea TaxID=413882 RepID=A0A0G3BCQ3_9BURK|nr:chemotaxis protein CheA [Caldimonas brevitalea]AKJ27102.1 chemotaxis protein CheA [Caldimonas brevitalea]